MGIDLTQRFEDLHLHVGFFFAFQYFTTFLTLIPSYGLTLNVHRLYQDIPL